MIRVIVIGAIASSRYGEKLYLRINDLVRYPDSMNVAAIGTMSRPNGKLWPDRIS